MSDFPYHDLLVATWQTIYMVFFSSFFSVIFGLILGVILFNTRRYQAMANQSLHQVLSFIVNVIRSVPFIILMIAIIPLTRWIVGSSIGTNAAIIPLVFAAVPFYARVAESALAEVPTALLEAANAMGATQWQIIHKFLLPEALSSLTRGATLTIIGLIGYSAMAGAIGGGGLGELAIDYGYQRFHPMVMLATVVILVLMVQWVQITGDYLAKRPRVKATLIACVIFAFVAVGGQLFVASLSNNQNTLRVGIISGVQEEVMKVAVNVAKKQYGLKIKIIPFDDYVLPNTALNDGEIDANIFQHIPYLQAQIKARGYHIVPIAKTFVYLMGFYSRQINSLTELQDGATVAIPNDPSNEGRALLLLNQTGLITLRAHVGLLSTPKDVVDNPRHLQFKLLGAAQLPRVLNDVILVALTNDYVQPAGFTVSQALIKEGSDAPYANIIVVKVQNKDNPLFTKLIATMHSPEVVQAVNKAYPNGAAIPAW